MDSDALGAILDKEAKRSGKRISPMVTISSEGGDVDAAIRIGRDLRRSEAFLSSIGPHAICYSACVFIAAGAVERFVQDVGIHRPYFSDLNAETLVEADQRYKHVMIIVNDYLKEMNINDEVFQIMESVSPGEIRRLTPEEAERLGFLGTDPAYEMAYCVDSGCSTCSVLSGGNLAAIRNFFDGSGPFACAIPEGLL